jgi:uncharacterized protein
MTDDVSGNRLSAWYELFSRGARDWLRHNEKVRDAVRAHLPQVVAGADVLTRGKSTVRVPVRMLEHYRFRLRAADQAEGVGQGTAKPGDRIETGTDPGQGGDRGSGGDEDGGIQYTLEFQVDDIVDWMWEEMQLPNLENRMGKARDEDWTREGWDRRGARSRLDRRRSLKESLKRQATAPPDAPPFTDEDLRYRQLAKREQPATQAVVFLVLDVSASMGEEHRKLAKSFFFWAVQGLRRQYRQLEVVFIAHTTEAWEFAEEEFFRVTGSGGTFMSSALTLARGIADERYSPSQYNLYLFYASDGENSPSDKAPTDAALDALLGDLRYCGFLEVGSSGEGGPSSDVGKLFLQLAADGQPTAAYRTARVEDIWGAVRHFFGQEQAA